MKSLLLVALLAATPAFAGTAVPVAPFRSIQLEGGGHVVIRHGATQQVTLVSGSTEFTKFKVEHDGQLVISACNWNCPHHYDLQIEIVTPGLEGAAIEGGGEIDAAPGFPAQRNIAASIEGGGIVDLRNISAESADASIEGGGLVKLHAERALQASVEGGGEVRYWGSPQVSSSIEGGGNVRPGA
ncbi:MAG TPA: DUF2807 domain-containing protein [Rhizomicrobium sp.]|nr:DUF2807 domain-containing protein [Rhizomicrobium sp.]